MTGTTFGGFEVLELIGRGGMGLVYRARQVNLDREVALKILSPDLAANRKFITRFVREARAAGRLSHPNIVQGIDVGEIEGRYFFAMELVPGKTLLEQLRSDGPIDEPTARRVMRKVVDALAHAARHGIVHRDIKPDNILLDDEGEPKLADLGLAKVEQRSDDDDGGGAPGSGVMSTAGSKGAVLGTPAYISPEQAMGKKTVDTRSDLYSLGMSIHHLLTGKLPFAAGSKVEMLAMHFETPMPDVRALAPHVSEGLARLLLKLGEKDPDERPDGPEEVLEALDAIERGEPLPWETVEGQERRLRQRRRRKRQKAMSQGGIALAAVAGVILVALVAWPSGTERRRKPRKRKKPRPTKVDTPRTTTPAATATGRPDTPPGPAPAPVETPFQQKLREALEAAQQYEVDHPADLTGTIERYREAMGPENPESTKAATTAVARLERKLAKQAAAAIDQVKAAITADLGAERFGRAWAAFAGLPAEVRTSADGAALRAKLEAGASNAFDSIRAAVDSAQRDSDWAAVRAALEPVLEWGVPGVVSEAKRMLAAVANLEQSYESMKAESYELGRAYLLVGAVPALLAKREVAAARTRCPAQAARDFTTARAKELIADEQAAIADVAALAAAVAGAGDIARGTPFTAGNLEGKITEIKRDRVGLSLKRGSTQLELDKLEPADYLALAKILLEKGAAAPEDQAGDPWAGWVVLAAAIGDADGATAVVDGREFAGDTGLRLQMRISGAETVGQEMTAARLLADAEAAVQAKDGAKASELLDRFEEECSETEMMLGSRLRRRDVRRSAERLMDGHAGGGHEPGKKPAGGGGHELPGGG
ncbi:MAG: serine/threonine-protein kinase [Planctomycetota bacterium]